MEVASRHTCWPMESLLLALEKSGERIGSVVGTGYSEK